MTDLHGPPVRVLVLLDGVRVSRHARDLIAFLESEPGVDLVGVRHAARPMPVPPRPLKARVRRWLYRLDARLARLGATHDPGQGVQEVAAEAWPLPDDHPAGDDRLSAADTAGDAAQGPAGIAGLPGFDLLIRAGGAPDAQVLPLIRQARYGGIGFDFSLSAPPDETGLGFVESFDGMDQAGIVLYAAGAGLASPWVIRRGWYQTHWSVSRTRALLLAAALRMMKDAVLQCLAWHRQQPVPGVILSGSGSASASGEGDLPPAEGLQGEALCRLIWPAGSQAQHETGRKRVLPPELNGNRLVPVPLHQLLAYARRTAGRIGRKAIDARKGRSYLWQLGFLRAGSPTSLDFGGIRLANAPGKRFQADPCLVQGADGQRVVFIEEWEPRLRRGHISALAVEVPADEAGPAPAPASAPAISGGLTAGHAAESRDAVPPAGTAPEGGVPAGRGAHDLLPVRLRHLGKVITSQHHMSFPFHFRWQGDDFLCPEMSGSGRITVWRAKHFPTDWTPIATLMKNVAAVDTMLFEAEGRWWMLTNLDRTGSALVQANRDFHAELHVFHAAHPLSQHWTPHPMNPVRIDSHGGRNAGILVSDDGIFRYGQIQTFDCYGHGIAVYRIVELSEHVYREELVREIYPDTLSGLSGAHGLHTLSQAGSLAVIDLLHRGDLGHRPGSRTTR